MTPTTPALALLNSRPLGQAERDRVIRRATELAEELGGDVVYAADVAVAMSETETRNSERKGGREQSPMTNREFDYRQHVRDGGKLTFEEFKKRGRERLKREGTKTLKLIRAIAKEAKRAERKSDGDSSERTAS